VARNRSEDVVDLLRADHRQVKALVARLGHGDTSDRWRVHNRLTELVVRHEVAEERVVYPELLRLGGGAAVADSRLDDQSSIEQRLIRLDREPFDSEHFRRASVQMALALLGHLDKEEAQVLPLLATKLSMRRRLILGGRFLEVKASAPSRRVTASAGVPGGRAIVDATTALATFLRDAAAFRDLAS
jgi:hypothetical protein